MYIVYGVLFLRRQRARGWMEKPGGNRPTGGFLHSGRSDTVVTCALQLTQCERVVLFHVTSMIWRHFSTSKSILRVQKLCNLQAKYSFYGHMYFKIVLHVVIK